MKLIIGIVFIAVAFCSCSNDVNNEARNKSIGQNTEAPIKSFSDTASLPDGRNGFTIYSDSSLIGKNTDEVENMDWFSCAGTIIGTGKNSTTYAVSQLSYSQAECRNGKGKIVLEKLLYKSSDGKPVFEIVDEIDIESKAPEREYSWTYCKLNGGSSEQFYVIHFTDQRQAELTEIRDLWEIDLEHEKFKKVKNAEHVTCFNNDFTG